MTCKEFERLIPDYVGRKLDYPTLKEFYAHVRACEACKEELSINFLVTDGLHRLESGDAFDLQKELNGRMEETKRKIKRNDGILRMGFWLEILAVAMIAGVVLWLI